MQKLSHSSPSLALWPAAVAFLFSFPFSLSFSRFVLRALIFFGFFVSAFFREPAVLFSWSVPNFWSNNCSTYCGWLGAGFLFD